MTAICGRSVEFGVMVLTVLVCIASSPTSGNDGRGVRDDVSPVSPEGTGATHVAQPVDDVIWSEGNPRVACADTNGCGIGDANSCGWMKAPSDSVEQRLVQFGIRMDGGLADGPVGVGTCRDVSTLGPPFPYSYFFGMPAVKFVDSIADKLGNGELPGPTGDDEAPLYAGLPGVGAPSGVNNGCSVIWLARDGNAADNLDDSFLYVAWDISNRGNQNHPAGLNGYPVPFDVDANGSACRKGLYNIIETGNEYYKVSFAGCADLTKYDQRLVKPFYFWTDDPDYRRELETSPELRVVLDMNEDQSQALQTSFEPPWLVLQTVSFPTADGITNWGNACVDQERDLCAPVGVAGNNVELVIKHVETSGAFGVIRRECSVVPLTGPVRCIEDSDCDAPPYGNGPGGTCELGKQCSRTGAYCDTDAQCAPDGGICVFARHCPTTGELCDGSCPGGEECTSGIEPDSPWAAKNRLALGQLMALLYSGAVLDHVDEDSASVAIYTPMPGLEVTKRVRCVDVGSTGLTDSVDSLPDALVEYEVTIQNTGNEDLAVTVQDLLHEVGAMADVCNCGLQCSFMQAMLTSPRRGLTDFVVTITNANGSAICPAINDPTCLNPSFFFPSCNPPPFVPDVSFLESVANHGSALAGTLLGAKASRADDGTCEFLDGDTLVIRFRAKPSVANDVCVNGTTVDCENAVTVHGTVVPPMASSIGLPCASVAECDDGLYCNGAETCSANFCAAGARPCALTVGCSELTDTCGDVPVDDTAKEVDTDRENHQGFDDNVANVNLACRRVDFTKWVGFQGDDASFRTGDEPLIVPDIPIGEFRSIEFLHCTSNGGEIDESFEVTDQYLCRDIQGTLDQFSPAEIDTSGCPMYDHYRATNTCANSPVTVQPGDEFCSSCVIVFKTQRALEFFIGLDDGHSGCEANNPPALQPDRCYRNCADATATALPPADMCDDAPALALHSEATLCNYQCDIEVTKRVICVDNCTDMTPTNGWYDDGNDPMPVAPGASVVFEIEVKNVSSIGIPVCALEFTDVLTRVGTEIDVDMTSVELWAETAAGSGFCPPVFVSPFNVAGTPFVWDPSSCPDYFPTGKMLHGDVVKLRFCAKILQTADPAAPDPVNTVQVRCASNCEGSAPAFCCVQTSTVELDIKSVGLSCTKSWAEFMWNSNGDCEPEAPFVAFTDPMTNLLDKVFPVVAKVKVCATNTGEVPLMVTATDDEFLSDVLAVDGVTTVGVCEFGAPKSIMAGQSACWECSVRFDTAEAAREFATKDNVAGRPCGDLTPNVYGNQATVVGQQFRDGTSICVNPEAAPVTNHCCTKIKFPPPCDMSVTKGVRCTEDATGAFLPEWPDVLPGSWVTFQVLVKNESSTVKIPRLCLNDVLDCVGTSGVPGPITAKLGTDIVTTCVAPHWPTCHPSLIGEHITFAACRPLKPWIDPGETLDIRWDVHLPANGWVPGADPDCINTVTAYAYSEVCPSTERADNWCSTDTNSATIDVKTPKIDCGKLVCGDLNKDGKCDSAYPFTPALQLPCDVDYPLNLIYQFTLFNTNGETALATWEICDLELVQDAKNAGFSVGPCDLCDDKADCSPLGDGCASGVNLPAGGSVTVKCQMTVPTWENWLNFAGRDADLTNTNGNCYQNISIDSARVNTNGFCDLGSNASLETQCGAEACIAPLCEVDTVKQVRCLPNCTTDGLEDDEGWTDEFDILEVTCDACLEYRIINSNGSTRNVDICALDITDLMKHPENFDRGPYAVLGKGDTVCQPPFYSYFNWDGVPVLCNLVRPLAPGEETVIHFRADVTSNGCGDIKPISSNGVEVACAPVCPATGTPTFCGDIDVSSVGIEPLPASLTCLSKKWKSWTDENVDEQPDATSNGAAAADIDLSGEIFPANLKLLVTAKNTGQVPLEIWAEDPDLVWCITHTPGVFPAPDCELGSSNGVLVQPGSEHVFTCGFRVETAEAMRLLDACDGVQDRFYRNTAQVFGRFGTEDSLGLCVSHVVTIDGDDSCSATIKVPKNCIIEVTKKVKCEDDSDKAVVNTAVDIDTTGWLDTVDALDGSTVAFKIWICNASTDGIRIVRLNIEDTPDWPDDWYVPLSVQAGLRGANVTPNCICPAGGCQSLSQLNGDKDLLACLLTEPWLDAGECITIGFKIVVGGVNDTLRADDYTNFINVRAYTEHRICPPPIPQATCSDAGSCGFRVLVTDLRCDKDICADLDEDAVCDVEYPFTDRLIVKGDADDFPLDVIYRWSVDNPGDVPLTNAGICDPKLCADAHACGIHLDPCDLDTNSCCSLTPVDLPPSGSSPPQECTLNLVTKEQWECFAARDGGAVDCYENKSNAAADVDTRGLAVCVPQPLEKVESPECSAIVCISVEGTICKTAFTVWNENEVKFTGMHECIPGWKEWRLSTQGVPNHFLRQHLQTDKGKAWLECMRSDLICPDSVDAPILGVAAQVVQFHNGNETTPTGKEAWGAMPVVGWGSEKGKVLYSPHGGPTPSLGNDMSLLGIEAAFPAAASADIAADVTLVPGVPAHLTGGSGSGGGQGGLVAAPDDNEIGRSSASQKGSLLVYGKVEVKWDATGKVVQDTFIDLTNDYPGSVAVQMYLVDGESEDAVWVDNTITLTGDEPAYWSVASGLPKGTSPIAALGPARPDEDPGNAGGTVLRGYLLVWAVNEITNEEIRWNHLSGDALIVNYSQGYAWDYNAWAFRAIAGVENGEVLLPPTGQLDLDDLEYQKAPATLVLDFYASGAMLFTDPAHKFTLDTDLTLWVGHKSLRRH